MENKVFSISEYIGILNTELKRCAAKIIGEVGKVDIYPSGHVYFSLRDEKDQSVINCIIWKSRYELYGVKIKEGVKIIATGRLYNFAESIVDAFGFDFDHCFGFFDNFKNWAKSATKYELFANLPETRQENPDSKSVKKTEIQQVFRNKDDKMLFLFDYGDNWEFIVKLKSVEEPDFEKSYPEITESAGRAPEQYPPLEEE